MREKYGMTTSTKLFLSGIGVTLLAGIMGNYNEPITVSLGAVAFFLFFGALMQFLEEPIDFH